jgi:hypothetical protein
MRVAYRSSAHSVGRADLVHPHVFVAGRSSGTRSATARSAPVPARSPFKSLFDMLAAGALAGIAAASSPHLVVIFAMVLASLAVAAALGSGLVRTPIEICWRPALVSPLERPG